MFLERLSAIQSRVDGALALSLVDGDGIQIEAVSSAPDLDLELLAAEMLAQLRLMAEHHRDLAVGEIEQFSVTTDQMSLMVAAVAKNYYLLLVLAPEGSYGRARFELRRAGLAFASDLE